MKWLALLCAVGIGAAAQASFELLLVADNGLNTFATRRIHRFDPQSEVYLGSFGGFNADIASTSLNKATNSLFVMSGNGTTEWDYNTGELKNSFTLGGFTSYGYAVRTSGDRVAFFDNLGDFGLGTFPGNAPFALESPMVCDPTWRVAPGAKAIASVRSVGPTRVVCSISRVIVGDDE